MLKIIAGVLEPSSGRVRYGKDVVIGYFSQELADLNPENRVIDELLEARHMTLPEARSYLARYMFRGDEVFKPVSVLSGGERNRLTLAKLVLTEANLLLLDEPTNHLDIPSREALEESLRSYGGTLIFVSHDRYFLDSLAKRIWVVDNCQVVEYQGTYSEYRARLATGTEHRDKVVSASDGKQAYLERREAEQQRRSAERAARKAAKALETLEAAIAAAEVEKQRLENALADTALYSDAEQVKATAQAHRDIQAKLAALYTQWEQMVEAQAEVGAGN